MTLVCWFCLFFFFFKQKTAYEMRISDWSSDVCSSDLLVQLDDDRAPDEVAGRSYIQPLHALLAKHPIKDAKWFLSEQNTFARDSKGRLVAFPYMVDVPVMYYNVDAFKKADLKPAVPRRAWRGLQDQLVTLEIGRASGRERVWQYV